MGNAIELVKELVDSFLGVIIHKRDLFISQTRIQSGHVLTRT